MRVVRRRRGFSIAPMTKVVQPNQQKKKPQLQQRFNYTPPPQRVNVLSRGMWKSLAKQAADLDILYTPIGSERLLPGPYHYNSGLLKSNNSYWLAYRRQNVERDSDIAVVELSETLEPIASTNRVLKLPNKHGSTEQFEDPRLFWFGGTPWIAYVSWKKFSKGASINVCQLDGGFNVTREVHTTYGGNWHPLVFQKNWVFFEHDGRLLYIYLSHPHEIVDLNPTLGDSTLLHREDGITWKYGTIRGGTPPVKVGKYYYSFFHSRMMGSDKRFRYFMGAYAFDGNPPFKPILVTSEPILVASEEDDNIATLPLVVFPCGAVLDQDRWVVSLGVNDVSTAIVEVSHVKLESWLKSV